MGGVMAEEKHSKLVTEGYGDYDFKVSNTIYRYHQQSHIDDKDKLDYKEAANLTKRIVEAVNKHTIMKDALEKISNSLERNCMRPPGAGANNMLAIAEIGQIIHDLDLKGEE